MLETPETIQFNYDLGRLADITALQTKYPTGRPGDFVRLNSTNTIWYWNGTAWTDTLVSASTLTGGKVTYDDTDPTTVGLPPAGKIFSGNFSGRMWTLDSAGEITYQTGEDLTEYVSQGNSYIENVKEKIRTAAGKVYASTAGFIVGSAMYANTWKKSNLVLAPVGTKAGTGVGDGKLYSVKGSDFTTARNSKKSRIDADGYIRRVGLDEVAIDYSSGKAAFNLEPQSTNKILYPFSAENSYWVKSGLTVDTNGGAFYPSPFKDASGNVLNVARKMVENLDGAGTTNVHNYYKSIGSLTSGNDYSIQVIAKAADRSRIGVSDAYLAKYIAVFDLKNGTILYEGDGVVGKSKITELSDGWYLCSIVSNAASTTRYPMVSTVSDSYVSGTSLEYQGDGTSGIYIAGMQLEEGKPTSFINDPEAVEGSEVTRVIDDITQDIPINSDDYCYVFDVEGRDGWYNYKGQFHNSGIMVYSTAIGQIGIYNSYLSNYIKVNIPVNNHFKIALRFKGQLLSVFVDGVKYVIDSDISSGEKQSNIVLMDANSNVKRYNLVSRYDTFITDEKAINLTK